MLYSSRLSSTLPDSQVPDSTALIYLIITQGFYFASFETLVSSWIPVNLQFSLFLTPFVLIFLLLRPSQAISSIWSRSSARISVSPPMCIPAQLFFAWQRRLETIYASSKHTQTSSMTSQREQLEDWTRLQGEKSFWYSRTGSLAT